MALPTQRTPGRIFISYRRDETAFPASWLYERLAAHFGPDQVFKDVDSIELGDDFAEVIADAVGTCDVLLVLIGAHWLGITDEAGGRRLENSDDFVRLEIEAALQRKVRIIPILVGRTKMPRPDELPDSLGKLVHRQALELDPNRFEADIRRLLRVVEKTLVEEEARREAEARRVAEEEARREAEARRVAEEARRQDEADQRTAKADEERQRQEPPEETQRPVLPPAKFTASAPPVEATEVHTTLPIEIPPPAPPGDTPAGARPSRRLLTVAGLGLVGLLVAGGIAYLQYRGEDEPGGLPLPGASTGPSATASSTMPADEVCTKEIQSNPRWVCLTSAVLANGKLTVKYHPVWGGATPDKDHGFHLHIYGGDGKNPPDYLMGTQAPKSQQGRYKYFWVDEEPKTFNTDESKAIARYPKVCARIAIASHGLVHDTNGGYRTGNCVPITRS